MGLRLFDPNVQGLGKVRSIGRNAMQWCVLATGAAVCALLPRSISRDAYRRLHMTSQTGNLSAGERTASALLGVALSIVTLTAKGRVFGAMSGILAGGLLARAAAGHCGIKAALQGGTTRGQRLSNAVDESLQGTFPASDPPASHLPDEPPSNAEAKWAAARAAGEVD